MMYPPIKIKGQVPQLIVSAQILFKIKCQFQQNMELRLEPQIDSHLIISTMFKWTEKSLKPFNPTHFFYKNLKV